MANDGNVDETNNVSGQPGFGTYTQTANGVWSNVAENPLISSRPRPGWSGAPDLLNVQFSATGGPDGYVRNVYRLADEVDLLAGRVSIATPTSSNLSTTIHRRCG